MLFEVPGLGEMSSAVRCPRCGSGNVVGYAGEWECFDCGHKFRLAREAEAPSTKPSPSRIVVTPQVKQPPTTTERTPVTRGELSTGKTIVLFVVGLFLAITVFPIAFMLSAALGYALGIIAIVFSIILIAKRGGRSLPLALGALLLVFSLISIAGTAIIHIGAYAVAKAVEEVTRTETVEIGIGAPARVDDWEIVVERVLEGAYIRSDESYYGAEEGMKLILIRLKIRNIGEEIRSTSDIWDFTLVTDMNKSYEDTHPIGAEWIFAPEEDVKAQAIEYYGLEVTASVAPNTYIEGDVLFQIPANEKPEMLYFKVGIVGPTQIRVKLA